MDDGFARVRLAHDPNMCSAPDREVRQRPAAEKPRMSQGKTVVVICPLRKDDTHDVREA